MAKAKSKTWQCSGTPDSPHDPFENFGPDCSICGAKREEIEKPSGKGPKPGNSGNGKKSPIIPIAAGLAGGLAVLGISYLLSPNIPGLCTVTENCVAWQSNLTKAKRNVSDAQTVLKKAPKPTKEELEGAQKKADEAIKLLNELNQQASLKKQVETPLKEAKAAHNDLTQKILAFASKPEPPKPTPTPTTKPTTSPDSPQAPAPVSPPVSTYRPEPEPEPIAREPRETYVPPASAPVREEPVYTREEPVYQPPVSPPVESEPASAPPRDEELIPR